MGHMRRIMFLILVLCVSAEARILKTENVVLITLDGVRTQEVFYGMDADLYRAIDKNVKSERPFSDSTRALPTSGGAS